MADGGRHRAGRRRRVGVELRPLADDDLDDCVLLDPRGACRGWIPATVHRRPALLRLRSRPLAAWVAEREGAIVATWSCNADWRSVLRRHRPADPHP